MNPYVINFVVKSDVKSGPLSNTILKYGGDDLDKKEVKIPVTSVGPFSAGSVQLLIPFDLGPPILLAVL